MTCRELAGCWPDRWPRPDKATNDRHRVAVRRFGRDFGGRLIRGLKPEECRHWAERNPGSLRYVITMFNDAVGDELIDHNPFEGLRLSKKAATRVLHVPTEAEVQLLAGVARGLKLPIHTAIVFAAYTGVRLGEVRAFSTLDLDNFPTRARIDYQLTRDDRLKAPKANGQRRIFLPKPAREALSAALRESEGIAPTHPPARRPGLLWRRSERQWTRDWGETRTGCGLMHLRWHDLRHHAATYFLDHGATVHDVATQLGCSPVEIERTYGHPDPEKALARLERLTDQ